MIFQEGSRFLVTGGAGFIGSNLCEAILPGIMQNVVPPAEWQPGRYVTYIGRCSEEKGIIEFIECARRFPDIPFMVAGAYDGMPHLKENSPANITWTGFLKGEALRNAFLDSRMVVVPSRCYEGFPNTIVQAMQLERSVVAVDLGSSGSIVQEGITGEKFRPMDVEDLIRKVASLYNDLERCQHYGKAGRREALRLYSRESIYERLMNIYEIATKNAGTK